MRDHGTHTYDTVNRSKIDAILDGLVANGSVITGSNPWIVDTRKHGVVLTGEWNEATLTLTITVTDAAWYVPQQAVWERLDALMNHIRDAE